jgi:hypothetical protein
MLPFKRTYHWCAKRVRPAENGTRRWPKLIIEGTNVKSQQQDRNPRVDLRQRCGGTEIALARLQLSGPSRQAIIAVISDPPPPGDVLVQFSSPVSRRGFLSKFRRTQQPTSQADRDGEDLEKEYKEYHFRNRPHKRR